MLFTYFGSSRGPVRILSSQILASFSQRLHTVWSLVSCVPSLLSAFDSIFGMLCASDSKEQCIVMSDSFPQFLHSQVCLSFSFVIITSWTSHESIFIIHQTLITILSNTTFSDILRESGNLWTFRTHVLKKIRIQFYPIFDL